MKNNNIFLGFSIIVFSILFLLGKFNLFYVFPVLIIFLGICLMPKKSLITTIIAIIMMVVSFSLIVLDSFYVLNQRVEFFPIEVNDSIEDPQVFLSVEAGDLKIKGIKSDKLIQGSSKSNFSQSFLTKKDNKIFIDFKITKPWGQKENLANKIELLISNKKEVGLILESVLSAVSIKDVNQPKIKINSMLSDINLDVENNTEIEISTFLSSININMLGNTGVRIFIDSNMSAFSLDNFIKIDDNTYQTIDYEEAKSKAIIKLDGTFSSLKINKK